MRPREGSSRYLAGAIVLLLAAAAAGCAPSRAPSRADDPAPVRSDRDRAVAADAAAPAIDAETELRALLLLIADRRVLEPSVVGQALEAGPALRRELAFALGRIGDARARPALFSLLTDVELEVRRAAAFALGRLPPNDEDVVLRLRAAAAGSDRETGIRAVASMARQRATLDTAVAALATLPAAEQLARLLPSLFRFPEPDAIGWAERGLALDDPELRRWAAYGLAREPQAAAVPALRGLLGDADPWIAGWAARALGRVGDRSDLERFDTLFGRGEAGPVIQALRAARALVARGAAAAPDAWRARLAGWLDDPRVGVRATALELAPVFLRDDDLGARLVERFRNGTTRRERELALLALAEGADPRAETLVLDASRDRDPVMRTRAAQAAAALGAAGVLTALAGDPAAAVRAAALAARLGDGNQAGDSAAALARAGLDDADPGVRATALEWLAEHAVVAVGDLVAAAEMPDRQVIVRHAVVPALAARAGAVPDEHAAAVAALEALALADAAYTVRRAAGDALAALDRPRPPAGMAVRRPLAAYREVVAQTALPRWVEITTASGTLRLRLDCPAAPLTCLSFLQLAAQGFYDGLAWHRVVPDFVVQAGDPRGDGRGGPGLRLRDEANLLAYRRGTLGMARAAPDTAGSQFFIALSDQPHLDGDYTAFGAVVAGFETLDRIVQGASIERVAEVPGPVQP